MSVFHGTAFKNKYDEIVESMTIDPTNTYKSVTQKKFKIPDIPYRTFFTQFLKTNKPCIIQSSSVENWKSKKEWVTSDGQPNYKFLEKKFGSSVVPVADCNEREYNSQHKINMPLRDYLTYWQELDENKDGSLECLYLKDWHFNREYPQYQAYSTPEYFSSDWLNEHCENESDDYKFVYMGPKGTWTPLHADVFGSFSWSANICGRKRWLLFPPGQEALLKDEKNQLLYLLEDSDLSKYKVSYLDVIQEAGEIIFVPSGWYHQVWNMENTISINHNWFNGCNILHIWHCLQKAASDVEREISDCKSSDDWEEQWQVILKVHHGLNHMDFLQILSFIFESRTKYLDSVNAEDCSKYWEIIFDVASIKSVCVEMNSAMLPKNVLEPFRNFEIRVNELISKIENK